MPTYTANITINVVPDKVYKVSAPANVSVYYSGKKVWGSGANNYFVANGTTDFVIESSTAVTNSVTLTEILTNLYDAYDGQGGTWCYQPALDRWTGKYSFRPDWMSMVANRLLTFKDGKPYIHGGTKNTFYGQAYDSMLAAHHAETGNTIKVYQGFAVEGDTPSRVHFRTLVPNEQSSDLETADFVNREGVKYSDIMRDRLSPNASGTYNQKVYTGDPVRGESLRFTVMYTAPTTDKSFRFVNLKFITANGQSV